MWPIGLLHLGIIFLRNWMYDRRILASRKLPVPVVSVGNIQLGGTGKTPMVLAILQHLEQQGFKVGILTRGYGRKGNKSHILRPADSGAVDPATIGDEPLLLLQQLKNGALGVGSDRYQTGLQLLDSYTADIVLLDDGFQHRRLHRDLDICLIDASRWRNHSLLYPFSYLRDSKRSLGRADAVILNKSEHQQAAAGIRTNIRHLYDGPTFDIRYTVDGFTDLHSAEHISISALNQHDIFAVCAIANPLHFKRTLTEAGLAVKIFEAFPDHHIFTADDLRRLIKKAQREKIQHLVFSTKDAVKIRTIMPSRNANLYFWETNIKLESHPGNSLRQLFDKITNLLRDPEKE